MCAGCATIPPPVSDPEKAWREREQQLADVRNWSAVGRVAVRSEDEAWNVSMHWKQRGDAYRIRFRAPFGQGLMELSGGPAGVVMRTSDNRIISAKNPDDLLFDAVGWRVPLGGLRYWILGRTDVAASVTERSLDVAGRLQRLQQSGWDVEYLRYKQVGPVELPTKVFVENDRLAARIVVSRWELGT